ncbi:imidazole glycerol phosphate synthase subunit HisH [Mangrovibacillus cuniculi]|uniref:Imidazole glycerol phosphate synthase subunit HisH n=1 Tax=Mangrovibacillus cuniculi TaxID=2593652 RepID=A0A7S8CCI7_9BACI|nr:imidazole glycerol phosphate synthase subunit HisH [Mangrovibacillus cuniculi]QPC47461.1 imidazole glycerol phosphate synthase subunit HisH [Mangrovibacillus cuniculi]
MIAIIDYGMGNLFSVEKALERIGVETIITSDIAELEKADGLLLPGVGAFPDAMDQLEKHGLVEFLQTTKQPLLGICLGMQLLFEKSTEVRETKGLGLLKGSIVRFPESADLKIPHMGWNDLSFVGNHLIVKTVDTGYTYFVHSFYASELDTADIQATAEYGVTVPAVVARRNVMGMQFHPEKSSVLGMQLLRNFVQLVEKGENL